jgi:hypothetical protein
LAYSKFCIQDLEGFISKYDNPKEILKIDAKVQQVIYGEKRYGEADKKVSRLEYALPIVSYTKTIPTCSDKSRKCRKEHSRYEQAISELLVTVGFHH